MKVNLTLAAGLASLALATAATMADPAPTADVTTPKNLARQHLGANLLIYTPSNQTYAPTEAAAAWLDDDIATGWPALTGKQDYLLALPEPALVNNFMISERNAAGTVTLYAGDEAAPPGSKSWTVLAQDIPIDSINEKLGKPFGRFAKYILIETDLSDSGPWYSVYLYGEQPASAYHIQQRAQPVDPRTEFGPYTNPATSFSISSLYAHCKVVTAGGDSSTWTNAIDDNPQTGTSVPATQTTAGLAIQYDRSYPVERVSVLTDPGTKGKLELFVIDTTAQPTTGAVKSSAALDQGSQYIKAADETVTPDTTTVDLTGQTPVATINFDGTSPRASVDFTPATGTELAARWTPATAGQPLNIREINSFGDLALNDYELTPDTVAEQPQANETSGKETLPNDGGKETLPPSIGEELPAKTAFVPGVPVFPPNIPVSP
jgi:hypothetical protein